MADFTLADYKIQAYLLANAEKLGEITGRTGDPRVLPTNPQNFMVRKAVGSRNVSSGVNLAEVIANTLTEKDKITFVDSLPGAVRSRLVPYINFYKTIVDGEKEVDIRLEPGRVDPNFVRSAGVSQIDGTNQFSNPGVNIDSIEIVRLGGNPAEIDTNITFKLTLRALRLGHFFDRQKATSENVRKNFDGDLPEPIKKQLGAGVAWIDLIKINLLEQETIRDNPNYNAIQQQLHRFGARFGIDFKETLFNEESNGNIYDETKTKVKVELGYKKLKDEDLTSLGFDSLFFEQINDSIEAQKQVFFLNLVQNEIGYDAADGAQLSIDFVAAGAMSTTTRKNDILFDPAFLESEKRLNDQRCKILEKLPHKESGTERLGPDTYGNYTTRQRPANKMRAMVIDPFAKLTGDIETQARILNVQGRGLDYDITSYEDEVKTGILDSTDTKNAAIGQIETNLDLLNQIKRNLLIHGLYGAPLMHANAEEDDLPYGFDTLAKQGLAGAAAQILKSRVYMHHARKDHILNYVSSFLSPISDSNTNPYVQNFGDLYFFKEEQLGAKDREGNYNEYTQTELENNVKDLSAKTDEQYLSDLTNDSASNLIDGDEVQIEFTFLGDIIETALEIIAANNRLTEPDISNLQKWFNRSGEFKHAGSNIVEVSKTCFIQPFYWRTTPDTDVFKKLTDLLGGDIIMGDITYQSPADPNQEITVNLADLPISMIEYKKWFATHIGGTRRTTFFLKDYINMLMRWVSRLVGDAVNSMRTTTTNKEPPQITINKVFVNKKPPSGGSIFGQVTRTPGAANSGDSSQSAIDVGKIIEVINSQDQTQLSPRVLTIITQAPSPKLALPIGKNRRIRDRENNIPHIVINDAGNGVLRRINFSREDMPGLREARLFEGEDFAGSSLLREKYNASIEFEGNNFFKPGTVLYVEPGAIDLGYTDDTNSFARQLGLGGYYRVVRTTHNLYFAGKLDWQTAISTKWETFGDEFAFKPDPDPRPGRCQSSYLARYSKAKSLDNAADQQSVRELTTRYATAKRKNEEENQ